jgi:hypothetical protein
MQFNRRYLYNAFPDGKACPVGGSDPWPFSEHLEAILHSCHLRSQNVFSWYKTIYAQVRMERCSAKRLEELLHM